MFYLIYVSYAVNKMTEDDLLLLHKESQERNEKHDLTGILLYKGQSFMQMIEGKKQVVMDLFHTIKNDNRHSSVITIMAGEIPERNFENWSMGFCNMDQVGDFPHFDDYIQDNLALRSFQQDTEGAYKFMMLFNEVN